MNWQIEWMKCTPSSSDPAQCVIQAGWRATATQGGYTATAYGSVGFPRSAEDPFTPYAELTEEQVLDWVWAQIDKADIEANLQRQIDEQINPPVIQPGLPWV